MNPQAIDVKTRNASLALFRAMLAFIFTEAALGKWGSGGIPDWFVKQFEPTLLTRLPGGLGVGYYGIATLESVTAAALILSLFARRRFAPFALLGAEFTFCALGAGLRLSQKYADAGTLFAYFALTLLVHLAGFRPDSERDA